MCDLNGVKCFLIELDLFILVSRSSKYTISTFRTKKRASEMMMVKFHPSFVWFLGKIKIVRNSSLENIMVLVVFIFSEIIIYTK